MKLKEASGGKKLAENERQQILTAIRKCSEKIRKQKWRYLLRFENLVKNWNYIRNLYHSTNDYQV